MHLLVQVLEALLDLQPELLELAGQFRRGHAAIRGDARDRRGVVGEHRHDLALGVAGRAHALRHELPHGSFDAVRPLHHEMVDRQPVDVPEDLQLCDDPLVEAPERLDVALHFERALEPALLPELAHGAV